MRLAILNHLRRHGDHVNPRAIGVFFEDMVRDLRADRGQLRAYLETLRRRGDVDLLGWMPNGDPIEIRLTV